MDKRSLISGLLLIIFIILIPRNILIALLIFGLIVMVHEFGHYIVAKANGVYVEEFAIGMGPKLLGIKKKETLYSIRLFPIGGFCKMLGEDEEIEDERAFNRKSVLARISILLAGPFFNFILAFICAFFLISNTGFSTTRVDGVTENMPAEEVLQVGDIIKKINGHRPLTQNEMSFYIQMSQGEPIAIEFERDGTLYKETIVPQLILPINLDENNQIINYTIDLGDTFQLEDQLLQIDDTVIGSEEELVTYIEAHYRTQDSFTIQLLRNNEVIEVQVVSQGMVYTYQMGITSNQVEGSFLENLQASLRETISWIKITVGSVAQLLNGRVSLKELAGPVGMVGFISSTYEQVANEGLLIILLNLARMVLLLSANLGVLNLFPIPALDGGRTVFLLVEGIRGKPLDREKEGFVHLVGFALLMLLMVVVLFNDLGNLFS